MLVPLMQFFFQTGIVMGVVSHSCVSLCSQEQVKPFDSIWLTGFYSRFLLCFVTLKLRALN